MKPLSITSFGGVNTAFNPRDIPDNNASDCVNARVENGEITARNGFNLLEAAQANFVAVYGFEFAHGYSGTTEKEEYVSFEDVSGNVRAYSGNVTTLAKTEIKNGISSVNLHASEWVAAAFRSDIYLINPGNTSAPVYRHAIGDATSMTAIAVPTDPTAPLTYIVKYGGGSTPYTQMSWVGIDVTTEIAYTGAAHSTDSSVETDGSLIIGHSSSNVESSFEIDFNGATAGIQDYTNNDKFAITLTSLDNGFSIDETAVRAQFSNNDGTPKVLIPDFVKVKLGASGGHETYVLQFSWSDKTRADFDNVRKLKITYTKQFDSGASRLRVSLMWEGGIGMTQPAPDRTPGSAGLYLAYSYYFSTPLLESGLSPILFVPNSILQGYSPGANIDPLGVHLEVTATVSADSNVDNNRFYVQDNTANLFRLLVTQLDSDLTYDVRINSTEITRLTAFATSPFTFASVTSMFAHKGVAIWLYKGGFQNVRWARVGDPLRQASNLDEDDDLNRGATFSLADNFADEPLGGVSVGDAIMIAGKLGVHFQLGDYGAQATPPRKVAGSFGVAGKYAFCRWKDENGAPVMVYVSPNGQCYAARPGLQDDGDNHSLTEAIRDGDKSLKTWLLDGQGFTDYSTVQVRINERDDTLTIIMGDRGLKLRRPDLTGIRHWEPEEYNTPSGTIKYVASSSKYGIRWIRSTGQVDEDEFNYLAGQYVTGANRDGGNPMPQGYWRSKTHTGQNRRILRVFLQRDNEQLEARVRVRSLRRTQVYKFLAFRHWSTCLPDQSGFDHEIEVIIPESDMKYSRLTWEEDSIGKGTDK